MGRKPEPLKDRKTDLFLFRYPLHEAAKPGEKLSLLEEMESFQEWAKREGLDINQAITQAIHEHVERHRAGNFQTLLHSYEPEGIKSLGQIEQAISTIYLSTRRDKGRVDVQYAEICEQLRAQGITKNIAVTAERIAHELTKAGLKVWR